MKKVSPAVEQGAELSEVDRLRWQLKYLREEIHMALLYIDASHRNLFMSFSLSPSYELPTV